MKRHSIHSKPPLNEKLSNYIEQLKYLTKLSNRELWVRYVNKGDARQFFVECIFMCYDFLRPWLNFFLSVGTVVTYPITVWFILWYFGYKDRKHARKSLGKLEKQTRK